MNIDTLIPAEIKLINAMLSAHNIQAGTTAKRTMCVKSSFIAYGLKVAPGESVNKIERIQRELSNELTRQRARNGYRGRAVVRLRDFPLALEVPHPCPTPLTWQGATMRMGRNMALIGRSYGYDGAKEEYIDLDKHYHVLVAAMSGGGKSTLMRMALLTLTMNTSPDDLKIILVDLKNDDLTPFRSLPHVISYAGDGKSAAQAINYVHQIKTERIATQTKPFRLLLVIDELAELGQDKETLKLLSSILSTGRSLGINVWAGTQYPSAAAIGSVVSASFITRLVGMVDGKVSANVATKRANSGAESLCTPGDFLRVDNTEMVRMKSYHIDQDDTARMIQMVTSRKRGSVQAPVMASKRNEAEELADQIAEDFASGASKRSMAMRIFGKQYGGSIAAKIDAAIEVVKQRFATESATTTGATSATHTSDSGFGASSRSTFDGDNKIIKMQRKAG